MRFRHIMLIILAVALLLSTACAGKSARDQILERYEKIDVPRNFEQLPPEVQQTIIDYNSGEYYKAAMGFYNILGHEEWLSLHESAQYYFSESLYRVNLYQACQYELTKILFKGPENNNYFTAALVKLLAITYETKDETVIFAVLSNIPLEKFPRKFRNELIYLLGKMYFYQGQIDEAYVKFSQVDTGSAFFAKANYFMGIIEVQRKEYEKAKDTFEVIQNAPNVAVEYGETKKVKEMSKLATGQLFYAAAHDAPEELKEEIFMTAIKYYDQVDRHNVQWFETLFEKTWAATMIGRYDVSLGTGLTLSSPNFDKVFMPEIHLIEAITWYTLCKYPQARSTLNDFMTRYGAMHNQLKTYLSTKAPNMKPEDIYEDLLSQYFSAYDGNTTELPIEVLTQVLNDVKFLDFYEHVQELDREFVNIDSTPNYFRNGDFYLSTRKKMRRQLINVKKKAGRWALSELKDTEISLNQLLGNASNIDFELTDSERKRLEKASLYGVEFKSNVSLKEEELLSPAVTEDFQYWPFNGEFWEDELGYYIMAVEQECQ